MISDFCPSHPWPIVPYFPLHYNPLIWPKLPGGLMKIPFKMTSSLPCVVLCVCVWTVFVLSVIDECVFLLHMCVCIHLCLVCMHVWGITRGNISIQFTRTLYNFYKASLFVDAHAHSRTEQRFIDLCIDNACTWTYRTEIDEYVQTQIKTVYFLPLSSHAQMGTGSMSTYYTQKGRLSPLCVTQESHTCLSLITQASQRTLWHWLGRGDSRKKKYMKRFRRDEGRECKWFNRWWQRVKMQTEERRMWERVTMREVSWKRQRCRQ